MTVIHAPAAASSQDPLKAGLRAILNWLERPISEAALDSRIAHTGGPWDLEAVMEAGVSLGLEVSRHGATPDGPGPLPCLLWLSDGTVLTVLERVDAQQIRALVATSMDRPGRLQWADVWPQVRGQSLALVPRTVAHAPEEGLMASHEHTGASGRHGHWFWGPLLRSKSTYVQVALAALLVNGPNGCLQGSSAGAFAGSTVAGRPPASNVGTDAMTFVPGATTWAFDTCLP